ncbi:cytochrome P450 [Aspergillus undulatus]|uniref:cytochrome P450 n=1 Tax=Aspergillus undulatus TaxID=1810928 RepID=UPI003CCD2B4F
MELTPTLTPVMLRAPAIVIVVTMLILTLRLFYFSKGSPSRLGLDSLESLPTIGLRGQRFPFPWARATLSSLLKTKEWAIAGYQAHSESDQPFILPSLDRGPVVILPLKQVKPTYGLPETIVDAHNTQNETIQTKWTIWDQEIAENSKLHINVIRNQMTRNLGHLVPVLAGEIAFALKRSWGAGTQWKELVIWDSCLEMIAGAGNAAFCGYPLCRDAQFLEGVKQHGLSVFAGATVINAAPKPFKHLVGGAVRLLCYYYSQRAARRCLPLVKERLEHTARLRLDTAYPWDPPKDALQWIIDECYTSGQPQQLAPERVAQRLLLLNVISLHSTSFTLQNVILDLASTDPSAGVIDALREECRSVLQESGSSSWTYEAVKKLRLVDSAVRESMRLTPFANVGLPRTVVHPDGVLLQESSNIRLPQGTMLALPLGPIQRDAALYPDPEVFDVSRFARGHKPRSALALDEGFLGFGFGQHACPGRFFALNEVKLVVAQMLLHYDIEHIPKRPASVPIMWLNYPAPNATVRVRRRREAVGDEMEMGG